MEYDSEKALLELTGAELSGAVSALGLRLGPIAPARLGAAGADAVRAFEDGLARLPDEARDLLDAALSALTDPTRAVKLHAIAGEDWLHRAVYAWSGDTLAMLASRAGSYVLGLASADDITAVLTTSLLVGGAAIEGDTRLELDGRAAIALVAAGDALRFGRLIALARHVRAPESVTAAEVAARFAGSTVDDPRWSTNLYASVLPFDAGSFMDAPTVELAMTKLAAAGLFAITERSGAMPAHFHPTDEGLVVLDALANAGGRAALTLYEVKDSGEIAFDSMLLARGTHLLAAVDVSPAGGGLMVLSTAAFATLTARITGG